MWFCKPKITRAEAEREMLALKQAYWKKYPSATAVGGSGVGFLTGSSLVGNKQGDSARFWELRKVLDEAPLP
jgi:hypothetical protein